MAGHDADHRAGQVVWGRASPKTAGRSSPSLPPSLETGRGTAEWSPFPKSYNRNPRAGPNPTRCATVEPCTRSFASLRAHPGCGVSPVHAPRVGIGHGWHLVNSRWVRGSVGGWGAGSAPQRPSRQARPSAAALFSFRITRSSWTPPGRGGGSACIQWHPRPPSPIPVQSWPAASETHKHELGHTRTN